VTLLFTEGNYFDHVVSGISAPVEEILVNRHGQILFTSKFHYYILKLKIKEKKRKKFCDME
jgi:hypothetical protein